MGYVVVQSYLWDLKEINWESHSRSETMHIAGYHRVHCKFIPFLSHCNWFIGFIFLSLETEEPRPVELSYNYISVREVLRHLGYGLLFK